MDFEFYEAPPPPRVPVDEIAETLGLVNGLRALRYEHNFRCACCHILSEANAWGVWVPDGIEKGDSPSAVEEICRLTHYNGSSRLWCLACAPKAENLYVSPAPAVHRWEMSMFEFAGGLVIAIFIAWLLYG